MADRSRARANLLRERAQSARLAINRTALGASVRRAREVDLGSSALVLAAQQLLATIPLLVVLAAGRPVARAGNFGVQLSRYLGLSAKATHELRSVFAGSPQVRTAATAGGLILLAFFAFGAAQAHQRVYELAWRVKESKSGSWSRQLRWVAALLGYVAALAGAARLLGSWSAARPAFIAITAPITAAFYWWSQRTLLARRIRARSLWPGATIIATGMTVLLVLSPWVVSGQVTSSTHEFGPIGVTFVLASWLLVLSILVVAGTVAGAAIVTHREASREHPK